MSSIAQLSGALADRYRIERELGAGGMATVYLAHDLRHDRNVALKVLKPELAAVLGGERFLAEIKTTANLQHPHILALFDSGQVDGTVFYAMPFVEGESLRDRLAREKQLPIDDAIRITSEVADALAYAHAHGVIHRDIKPENILLHGGHALVADFGIALAASTTGGTRMTETGMSLGTPTYMSPEQAMGERTLDARTDLYALGCVLYEMLTGDPPFTGSTAQAIVAKVLTEKPAPIIAQRDRVPQHVEDSVLAALSKLPADRPSSAAVFAAMLHGQVTGSLRRATKTATGGAVERRVWILGTALVAASALAVAGWLRPRHAESPVLRYEVALAGDEQLGTAASNFRIAISRDGKRLAFVHTRVGGSLLWIRRRDELQAEPLPGSDGVDGSAFSPDGEHIAFLRGPGTRSEQLMVASWNGAPPVAVADSGLGVDGVSWGDDGYIYCDGLTGANGVTGLVRMRPDGSGRETVTLVDTAHGESDHVWPDALPGGKAVLFTIRRRMGPAVAVLDLATHRTRVLLSGANAVYVPPGHIVYTADAKSLVAAPFDVRSLQITGPGITLASVAPSTREAVELAAAASGALVYLDGGGQDEFGLPVWVDQSGHATPVNPLFPDSVTGVALSPDGGRLAVSSEIGSPGGNAGRRVGAERLFLSVLPGGALTPLVTPGERNRMPQWTPDGAWITYLSDPRNTGGVGELWRVPADGGGNAERLSSQDDFGSAGISHEWFVGTRSRDRSGSSTGGTKIVARRVQGDSAFVPLLGGGTRANESMPRLSPDGHWLAYVSDESGSWQLYVRPFPNANAGKWAVSSEGIMSPPLWAPDGRTIYYVDRANQVVASSIDGAGATLRIGQQQSLFDATPYLVSGFGSWDISHDGKRFLMLQRTAQRSSTRMFVIENLPALLERASATRR
ncbi:MAG TPA: protein kinase [Gemmatimonadaceae bacterium]|nr:protein kinase [Gemmatimonadaceae bacterium]